MRKLWNFEELDQMVIYYEFKNKILEKETQIRTRIKENKNIEKCWLLFL